MLYRKVALLVTTLLVLVGSAWEVEAGESYNLRVIYYRSKTFQFEDKIGEVFNDFTNYMTTLNPPIKVDYVKFDYKDNHGNDFLGISAGEAMENEKDLYISGFNLTYKPTDMFVYFIGNDEKVPEPGHGMVCSTNLTDRVIFLRTGELSQWGQFGPEEQVLMAKNLTEQMAKKLLLNPTCGAELLDGYVKFHTCASKAFQRYIDSFDGGNFCLGKPYYGLQLKFFADNELHEIDGKIMFPYQVVEPWYYKIRERFATLNPGISVYKTMVNYDFSSINSTADLSRALKETGEANMTIIVYSKLSHHQHNIRKFVRAGHVCQKDPLKKAIVVNPGSTKLDVKKALWVITRAIADKFNMMEHWSNGCFVFGRCEGRAECRGLMEGRGGKFSSCSSKELKGYVGRVKSKRHGAFCLPKLQ